MTPAASSPAPDDTVDGITIRAVEPSDGVSVATLIGGEGTFEGLFQMPHAQLAARAEQLTAFDPRHLHLVAVTAGGRVVGSTGLYTIGLSPRAAHRRGFGISLAPDWQGRGLGHRLMGEALDWADHWGGVLRIELTVYIDNARAIALYERHGFVREGLHRAYALRHGQYVDALAMARLHPRPPSLAPIPPPVA